MKYRHMKGRKHPIRMLFETKRGEQWCVVATNEAITVKPYRAGYDTTVKMDPARLYVAASQSGGVSERERGARGETT